MCNNYVYEFNCKDKASYTEEGVCQTSESDQIAASKET